jgi:hypothetical protein
VSLVINLKTATALGLMVLPDDMRRHVRSWRKLTLHPWRICWSIDRNLLSVQRQLERERRVAMTP